MARLIKIKIKKASAKKSLTPLQKLLLSGPTMTDKQYKEWQKTNKWMRKWKA
jgi:hypothetical protein